MLIQTRNVGFKRDILIQTTCQAKIERPTSISAFEIRKVSSFENKFFFGGGGLHLVNYVHSTKVEVPYKLQILVHVA